jgi:hypothetical protein
VSRKTVSIVVQVEVDSTVEPDAVASEIAACVEAVDAPDGFDYLAEPSVLHPIVVVQEGGVTHWHSCRGIIAQPVVLVDLDVESDAENERIIDVPLAEAKRAYVVGLCDEGKSAETAAVLEFFATFGTSITAD